MSLAIEILVGYVFPSMDQMAKPMCRYQDTVQVSRGLICRRTIDPGSFRLMVGTKVVGK